MTTMCWCILLCLLDSLRLYEKLIGMGFEEDISFEAAKKFQDLNKAVLYIIEQQAKNIKLKSTQLIFDVHDYQNRLQMGKMQKIK